MLVAAVTINYMPSLVIACVQLHSQTLYFGHTHGLQAPIYVLNFPIPHFFALLLEISALDQLHLSKLH